MLFSDSMNDISWSTSWQIGKINHFQNDEKKSCVTKLFNLTHDSEEEAGRTVLNSLLNFCK